MRRFDYESYNETEQVLISENGNTFFYNIEDDSGWWGSRVMLKNITFGSNMRDVCGFSSDGICEYQPGSSHTSVFVLD